MPDDYSNDRFTAGAAEMGSAMTGFIETSGDQDWFEIELIAGRTYVFDLEGSHTERGTLSDPYLRGIYDATGNLLPSTVNDDGGEGYNSRLTYTPSQNGTYYVSAGAYKEEMGSYTLSVTDVTPVPQQQEQELPDLQADTTTPGILAVGSTVNGTIESTGDRDWFSVKLLVGQTYVFDLEGSRTERGTLSDPYLRGIHNATGNLLPDTSNDDGGEGYNSRLTYTPVQSGIYYVSAGAFYTRTGTYTLKPWPGFWGRIQLYGNPSSCMAWNIDNSSRITL